MDLRKQWLVDSGEWLERDRGIEKQFERLMSMD